MSSKDIVQELLKKLPDEASLNDIAQEIEFVAGIREGIAELDRGQFLSAEQLRLVCAHGQVRSKLCATGGAATCGDLFQAATHRNRLGPFGYKWLPSSARHSPVGSKFLIP